MSNNNDHNSRWPAPSPNHVPEYQLSGLPFCQTKSINGTSNFEFPRVTRWITINSDQEIDIFFKSGNDTDNNQYFKLPANTMSPRLEIRCTKIYVKSSGASNVSVMAGLTNVLSSNGFSEDLFDWIE